MTKKNISSKKSIPKAAKPAAKPLKKAIALKKVASTPVKSKPVTKTTAKAIAQKEPVEKTVRPAVEKPTLLKKKKSKEPAIPLQSMRRGALQQTFVTRPIKQSNQKLSPFFEKQRQRLLQIKDMLLDSMSGVARGNLRSGCDASAFGMHQADAGSDAYDRDFALSILSQEQISLYEIDEALKRIDDGTYGICEISNKPILRARLEARPFTRYTVECQADLEKRQHVSGTRVPVSALFGITEEESENEEEEGFNDNPKD